MATGHWYLWNFGKHRCNVRKFGTLYTAESAHNSTLIMTENLTNPTVNSENSAKIHPHKSYGLGRRHPRAASLQP